MPNWVSNRVTVTGNEAELQRFIEQAKAVPKTFTSAPEDEKGDWDSPISFANFITPPQEALDSGEYWATKGWVGGEKSGDTTNNWYEFNTREWGTKWDASEPSIDVEAGSVTFGFNTAWSPPEPVFHAMAKQFPELEFNISFEEEQGWGGEMSGSNGEISLTDEWDIPESHADYAERDREDSCVCSYEDDKDEWYDDCPNKRDIFVQVTKMYRLSSGNLDDARVEYFQMETGTMELPTEEEALSSFVFVDEDGEPIQD